MPQRNWFVVHKQTDAVFILAIMCWAESGASDLPFWIWLKHATQWRLQFVTKIQNLLCYVLLQPLEVQTFGKSKWSWIVLLPNLCDCPVAFLLIYIYIWPFLNFLLYFEHHTRVIYANWARLWYLLISFFVYIFIFDSVAWNSLQSDLFLLFSIVTWLTILKFSCVYFAFDILLK